MYIASQSRKVKIKVEGGSGVYSPEEEKIRLLYKVEL